jgi:hypothetical protein
LKLKYSVNFRKESFIFMFLFKFFVYAGRLRQTREECAICGMEFSCVGRYMSHVAQHGPVLYQCGECNESFTTRLHFNTHQRDSKHTGQNVIPCENTQRPQNLPGRSQRAAQNTPRVAQRTGPNVPGHTTRIEKNATDNTQQTSQILPGLVEQAGGVVPGLVEETGGVVPGLVEETGGVVPGLVEQIVGVAPGIAMQSGGIVPAINAQCNEQDTPSDMMINVEKVRKI